MSQPEKKKEDGFTDSADGELIVIEGGGDTTVRPITDPRLREEMEQRRRQWQTPPQQPPSDAPPSENGPPST